jgi:hypothetical protein
MFVASEVRGRRHFGLELAFGDYAAMGLTELLRFGRRMQNEETDIPTIVLVEAIKHL